MSKSDYISNLATLIVLTMSTVIEKILTHLNEKAPPVKAPSLPKCRAPPQAVWFD